LELSCLSVTQESKGKQFKHTLTGYPKAISDVKVQLAYMQVEKGKELELVWAYEIDVLDHWWNAMVSAEDGEIIALYDWVDSANYNSYPIGTNDPDDGPRENVYDPAVSNASPLGWNDRGQSRTSTLTIGNNVYAQENWSGGTQWQNNYRPDGATGLDFNFPVNLNQQPDYYIDAATTNLFYWNNIVHDVFYQYGFDEVSGNFQEYNFGRGGQQNDAVQANCQDGSGYNNANFATPADGSRPRMRMYVWNRSSPNRDGDLDNGIIIHEYGHGISNRLTGGPNNVNCLSGGEAGGMGEGWGDWWATSFRQRSSYSRTDIFPMADYSNLQGIRLYPYTTLMSTNPQTYNYITRSQYTGVHAKGTVWCTILWEAYWDFVDEYGFSNNWYLGEGGNNMILQLVVDGLKLQPCRPSFVDARDAIIQADDVNYQGRHFCLLWQAFARRGLGVDAAAGGIESFDVPEECEF
jgi:extracellular elastinolytic metalloproteinase